MIFSPSFVQSPDHFVEVAPLVEPESLGTQHEDAAVGTQNESVEKPLVSFLKLQNLEQLIPKFEEQFIVEMEDMLELNEEHLKQMGVVQIGLINRFLRAQKAERERRGITAPTPTNPLSNASASNAASVPNSSHVVAIDLVKDDDVVMVDAVAVEEVPPPPPPPPPVCSNCADLACIGCASCVPNAVMDLTLEIDPITKPFCFACFEKIHPLQNRHPPRVIDQPLLGLQKAKFDAAQSESQNFTRMGVLSAISSIRDEILSQQITGLSRLASLRSELAQIEESVADKPLVALVLGDTGAGKSSTLNALIGERSLLPTNGMRACTASLVELARNEEPGKKYRAIVELLTKEEWDVEVC